MTAIPTKILAAAFLVSMSLPAFADSTAMREGTFGRSPSNYVAPLSAPPQRVGIGTGTTSPVCCGGGGGYNGPTSSADFVYSDPRVMSPPPNVTLTAPMPYPRIEPAPAWPTATSNNEEANPIEDLPKREEIEDYTRRQVTPTSETYWPEPPVGD